MDTTNTGPIQCNFQQPFTITAVNENITVNEIGIFDKDAKTQGKILISSFQMNSCRSRPRFIQVCNDVHVTNGLFADDIYLKMDTIIEITNLNIPCTYLGNGEYTLEMNQYIFPGACKRVPFELSGRCTSVLGQSYKIEVRMDKMFTFQDTTYQPYATSFVKSCQCEWDGSSLEVKGYCLNDTSYFMLSTKMEQ